MELATILFLNAHEVHEHKAVSMSANHTTNIISMCVWCVQAYVKAYILAAI